MVGGTASKGGSEGVVDPNEHGPRSPRLNCEHSTTFAAEGTEGTLSRLVFAACTAAAPCSLRWQASFAQSFLGPCDFLGRHSALHLENTDIRPHAKHRRSGGSGTGVRLLPLDSLRLVVRCLVCVGGSTATAPPKDARHALPRCACGRPGYGPDKRRGLRRVGLQRHQLEHAEEQKRRQLQVVRPRVRGILRCRPEVLCMDL